MGCINSKSTKNLEHVVVPPEEGGSSSPTGGSSGGGTEMKNSEGFGRLLPASKTPPTLDEARNSDEQRGVRLSVKYTAKELSGRTSTSRRSSTPFDRAKIGTHTRHGLMPGPRGFSAAKINQDRGVVCWPFNGSYNQALFCVFDGHGAKGERASEFCMTTIPELLEAESQQLKADPPAALSKAVIQCDQMLLSAPELGRLAMTCGTTSTVMYFHGSDCFTACSGDSRAVKGIRRSGMILAEDLSMDHKPDLPEERARIVANGGTVSDGAAGRPARVWAHGRIGLAMSRSLGDGECKHVGVIPDPEVRKTTITPADKSGGDGDLFIIVASDGVWEFIPSDEACRLVQKHKNATEACSALVLEAALRWKKYEGSYRDDITAIVAFLPFLEQWGEDEEEDAAAAEDDDEASTAKVFLNMGGQGLSWKGEAGGGGDGDAADAARAAEEAADGGGGEQTEEQKEFAARRLSVHNPYDEDWNDLAPDSAPEAAAATQRA